MDAIVKKLNAAHLLAETPEIERPSREEAEAAVRTLIAWAGDNPDREGLLDTPSRVAKAYKELYKGYGENPIEALSRTFEEVGGYDDIVLVKDISFYSHCEHHMVPFFGKAHVGYYPQDKVVGLSKLARVVDIFARRLQTQENLTAQITLAIDRVIETPDLLLNFAEHGQTGILELKVLHLPGNFQTIFQMSSHIFIAVQRHQCAGVATDQLG